MVPPPSTEWRERVEADEAARHQAQADQLAALQRGRSARQGAGRALHRKGVLGLTAHLDVKDGLPAHARHGLFATPGRHDVWVRLSNGSADRQPDRKPDIRGFALRVQGVTGDGALGGPATHQDFLLINLSAFGFPTSKDFLSLALAASKGQLAIVGWAYRTYGLRGMFGRLRALKAGLDRPFPGFAAAAFHSAAPIACGPYAARVRLTPHAPIPHPDVTGEWGAAMAALVAGKPVGYTLALQFFVDEARTPIEDASVDWPEDVAPYLPVADLTLAAQDVASAAGQELAARTERAVFDPWQALAAHRPLGEVMRARKVAYFVSQQGRGAEG
jgi:hypothetical protein